MDNEIFIHFIGQVAQSVEQRTENPCVGGSIPSLSTLKSRHRRLFSFSHVLLLSLFFFYRCNFKVILTLLSAFNFIIKFAVGLSVGIPIAKYGLKKDKPITDA